MKDSVLFAIVTYKEKYFECLSYLSLLKSFENFNKGTELNVMVFDNTDQAHWNVEVQQQSRVRVHYFHQNDNRGISYAYNRIYDFALKNNFEWIVFLDQDTTLPIEAYEVYCNKIDNSAQHLLAAPIVYANTKILSPCSTNFYQKMFSNKIVPGIMDLKHVTCINSGLMVNAKLYGSIGGYDENLKLDFCDHDFIERAKKEVDSLEILDVKFIQDFSTDNNTKAQSIFRYKIFIEDYKNYSKNRNKMLLSLRIDLKHLLRLTYKFRTFEFIKIRFTIS
jgi:GT2 family glycosyltransferase